jgi:hypothetical protein
MKKENNRKIKALKLLKQMPVEFTAVDLQTANAVPKWCTRAFYNNRYFVTINDNAKTTNGAATVAMIQNHFNTPIVNHWKEIFKIKNELFGEDTVAVEYYPSVNDLVDDKNIYWIWIFKEKQLPIPII